MNAMEILKERPLAEKLAIGSFLALGIGITAIRGGFVEAEPFPEQLLPESGHISIENTSGQN